MTFATISETMHEMRSEKAAVQFLMRAYDEGEAREAAKVWSTLLDMLEEDCRPDLARILTRPGWRPDALQTVDRILDTEIVREVTTGKSRVVATQHRGVA